MSIQSHFKRQFESELWIAESLASALKQANEPEPRSLLLFSHIAAAHHNWLNRIVGETSMLKPFEERTIDEALELYRNVIANAIAFLQQTTEADFEKEIVFTSGIDGSQRSMKVGDILTHMVTHGYYHRGQIVAQLKGKLEPLPLLTHIIFTSKRLD
ncbi:MAG: DinB family protein [Bacteroidia bacterium]|jgi:uncharacterized damage-inducible protein DinB|nr:DinB family protein [Bacteroidia bacterium]